MTEPERPVRTRLSIEFATKKQEADAARLSEELPTTVLPTYHSMRTDEILDLFGVDEPSSGLPHTAIPGLKEEYGSNVIKPPRRNPIWSILGFLFGDFNGFLWLAAALCFTSWRLGALQGGTLDPGNLALAIALVVVTLANIGTSMFVDFSSSAVMKSITGMMSNTATVIRDGQTMQIPTVDLVPGDVIVLALGDRVPADVRVLTVNGLKVDQSILTGESEPISLRTKCTSDNYLESKNVTFCGASVVEGSGTALVVATGNSTVMGSIAAKASKGKSKSTYLSREIRRLIIIIGSLCLFISASCFIAYVAWLRVDHKGFITWSGIVGICLGLMIGTFPVGLPLCVTATLLIVARRMANANVLVRDMTIIETLGSVNMIASDKTGTLTQNKMSVVEVLVGTGHVIKSEASMVKAFKNIPGQFGELLNVALYCNAASFDPQTDHLPLADRTVIGGASDAALLKWSALFVENIEESRAKMPIVAEIPFNSKNKYAVTIHKVSKSSLVMFMKGAAENMMDRCSTYLDQNGNEEELTPKRKQAMIDVQVEMCRKGERVLALIRKPIKATKDLPILDPGFNTDDYELPITSGFTFVGLVALMDPPRPEVPGVIESCHEAGIKVAMVTGDHPDTAETIAKMIGIIKGKQQVSHFADFTPGVLPLVDPEETHKELNRTTLEFYRDEEMGDIATQLPRAVVITGPEIATFTDAHWDWVLSHRDLVFARTSPENKLEIVKRMQARGYSVAVTGDGVNDSPALRAADVGVAMGGGSEVAKEAGAVILTDNNFASLLSGVESGRIVFANLKKVIRYLMPAGSFSEIWPVVFYVFCGLPQPLSTFLMLYICVITDVAPCISLVFQKGEKNVMKRKPRSKKAHLLDGWLYLQAYGHTGLIESLGSFILFFYYFSHYAGIPMSRLWLAYEKYTTSANVISTIPNPNGGFYTGKELDNHLKIGQSIFFIHLVIAQFGNLLGSKENRASVFGANPLYGKQKNLFLVMSVFISLGLAMLIVFIPGVNNLFGTRPVPWEFWLLPLYTAFFIFFTHELRKLMWRKMNWRAIRRWISSRCCCGH